MKTVQELLDSITNGWGERDVYPLEETDLDVLILQDGAETSTVGNNDGTATITVKFKGKQYVCTKQAASRS